VDVWSREMCVVKTCRAIQESSAAETITAIPRVPSAAAMKATVTREIFAFGGRIAAETPTLFAAPTRSALLLSLADQHHTEPPAPGTQPLAPEFSMSTITSRLPGLTIIITGLTAMPSMPRLSLHREQRPGQLLVSMLRMSMMHTTPSPT